MSAESDRIIKRNSRMILANYLLQKQEVERNNKIKAKIVGGTGSYIEDSALIPIHLGNLFLSQTEITDILASVSIPITHINGSITFNGSNSLSFVSATNLPIGNELYTIECWVKINSTSEYGIVGWGNYGEINKVNAFRFGEDQLHNYWWNNDLAVNVYNIADNNWHHVVCQYDGTDRRIYKDGIFIAGDVSEGEHNVTKTDNLSIGVTYYNEYFVGSISNLRIVRGVAVYSGTETEAVNFVVPIVPLTVTQSASTNISAITNGQTSILLNTTGAAPFIDSAYGYVFSVNGVAPTISSDSPFS